MQLVAYGAQDIYLTGQPQITFFKAVYRRHTNFAMESVQQTILGTSGFARRVAITADRRGDLILGAHLQLAPQGTLAAAQKLWSYENFCVTDLVELEIGNVIIDRIFGDWMALYAELVFRKGYGLQDTGSSTAGCPDDPDTLGTILNNYKSQAGGGAIYIPLLFWFQYNPGLALPLIALQYQDVKFYVTWIPQARVGAAGVLDTGVLQQLENSLGNAGTQADVLSAIQAANFFIDYGYLDTTERRKFAQNAHEYLISQHQQIDTTVTNQTTVNQSLNSLNHPVKYLAWRFWSGADASYLACDTYLNAKVTLNGQERFEVRPSNYFENMQVHQHWPCGGNQLTYGSNQDGTATNLNGKWSLYSFAIRPAEHQPSGTCNFSRIDNSQLVVRNVSDSAARFTLHAENYNVLRIMSGMGGLAYSN